MDRSEFLWLVKCSTLREVLGHKGKVFKSHYGFKMLCESFQAARLGMRTKRTVA
jgi:hypothetical protein